MDITSAVTEMGIVLLTGNLPRFDNGGGILLILIVAFLVVAYLVEHKR